MFYPKGMRLSALEKNILKYRAFEMVLVLFYAEDLKRLLINTIQTTDNFYFSKKNIPKRIPADKKKKFQITLDIFVFDGIISKKERNDITNLIDYRNIIGHDLAQLTMDIDPRWFMGESVYNYEARKRLKFYIENIPDRMQGKYFISVGIPRFKLAEKTYESELKSLDRKIKRQMKVREKENLLLQKEFSDYSSKPWNCEKYPGHPANKFENGRLTKKGIKICYKLFDRDKSIILVAHLMQISYQAALKRHKAWKIIKMNKKKI